jgi:arabinogalactan oligomer/maltooligosaccharide transport system substrate-binding protein
MVATQRRMDWVKRSEFNARLWTPLLNEFQRLHPDVRVSLSTVREEDLAAELKERTGRGLGPDLILTRGAMANTLLREGLIEPVPQTPSMQRTIAQVDPAHLRQVRAESELSAMPLADVVTLACYNKKTMPVPPRTTDELLATAASGRTVGISIDPFGIWWTAGTRGAVAPLIPVLLGTPQEGPAPSAEEERKIASWLAWLRQLGVQSRVDLASGPEELTQGLISARLDWIPCYSLTLSLLQEAMGKRLGISALPKGPGGPPSPLNSLEVFAFGLDSSARQRKQAAELVRLSVDPYMQRRLVLESQEVLPVNRFVETPVASSGVLAALSEAFRQVDTAPVLLRKPYDVRHLNIVLPQIEALIQQVVMGVVTPEEGAKQLLRLGGERAP